MFIMCTYVCILRMYLYVRVFAMYVRMYVTINVCYVCIFSYVRDGCACVYTSICMNVCTLRMNDRWNM
jgi:hypothetical protein